MQVQDASSSGDVFCCVCDIDRRLHTNLITPTAIMTSYIPSLTLPSFAFENPAVAILLPVLCGTATGFAISRKSVVDSYRNGFLIPKQQVCLRQHTER